MKKSKVTAAEERNEAMRGELRFILRHGDAKTRHALKKMLADAAAIIEREMEAQRKEVQH
jgi:hypothetical protein